MYAIKRLKQNLLSMFCRVSITDMKADLHYEAERELLLAEFNAEHWASHRDMLRARIERLHVNTAQVEIGLPPLDALKFVNLGADEDGFTAHDGGEMPVVGRMQVVTRMKDGSTLSAPAGAFTWRWKALSPASYDIVAYRKE
jgi:hypothetical protein